MGPVRARRRVLSWAPAVVATALAAAVVPAAGVNAVTAPPLAPVATAGAAAQPGLGLPPLSGAGRYILAPAFRTVAPAGVTEAPAVNDDYVQAGVQASEDAHALAPGTSTVTRLNSLTVRQAGSGKPGAAFSYTLHVPPGPQPVIRVEEAGSATSDYQVLVNGTPVYHRTPDPAQKGTWFGTDGLVHYQFAVPASAAASGAPGPGQLRITFVNSAAPGDGARIAAVWAVSGGSPAAPYGGTVTSAASAATSHGMTLSAQPYGRPYAIFDFGHEVGGRIQLTTSNPGPPVSYGLAFSESWRYMTTASDMSGENPGETETHALTAGSGTHQVIDPVIRGGFRYLMVYLAGPGSLRISDLRLDFSPDPTVSDPRAYQGAFLSASDQLNRLWYAGAYTVQMDTIDPSTGWPAGNDYNVAEGPTAITDGAKRDRSDWVGDQAVEDPVSYLTTGNTLAPKDSSEFDARGAAADGQVPGVYLPDYFGGSGYNYGFAEYASWWARNYWTYYLYTGDRAYLGQWFPTMQRDIAWLYSLIDSNGLINTPPSAPGFWGYLSTGEQTYQNALYVWTLDAAAQAADVEGQPGLATTYRQRAASIADAINTRLWDPATGAYLLKCTPGSTCSTAHPQDGNVMAVLAGVATGQRAASVLHFLGTQWTKYGALTVDQAGADLQQEISPFISYFELQAYASQNTPATTADAMNILQRTWPPMLTGDTVGTFKETLWPDGSLLLGSMSSSCHGWSAGPVPFLTGSVLGVTPASGGFSTFRALPHPPAGLPWAEGAIPTPHGAITTAWKQDGSSFALSVQAPGGTSYTAGVPDGPGATVTENGTVIWANGHATAAGATSANGYIQASELTGTTTLTATYTH